MAASAEASCILFFEEGLKSFTGRVESHCGRRSLQDPTRLAFIAAGTSIDALVEIPGNCTYTVAFIDADWLSNLDEELAGFGTHRSHIGFNNPVLVVAMAQLRNEVQVNRPMSRLAIESWTMQMWAHLHRSGAAPPSSEGAAPFSNLCKEGR